MAYYVIMKGTRYFAGSGGFLGSERRKVYTHELQNAQPYKTKAKAMAARRRLQLTGTRIVYVRSEKRFKVLGVPMKVGDF